MPATRSSSPRLRTRFILVTCVMLLPLLILSGVTFFSLTRLTAHFNSVVQEALEEKEPVAQLRGLVQSLGARVHGYVLFGEVREQDQFRQLATQAATRFAAIRDLPYFLPQERDHLMAAEKEWQRVLVVAESLIAGPGRPDPEGLGELRQIAAGLLVIEEELQNLLDLADLEIAEMRAEVGRVNRESQLLLAGVFLIGILTALASGGVLARSVLRPLRELERGTQEFAAGRLGHRLAEGRKDELGGLIQAFNAMAERLERQQRVLKQVSVRDSLTGLVNHREFYRHLHQELLRSRRYGHPLALLMLDLDRFKDVNDLFGHPAGDRVLRVVARVLRRQLRTSDLVGRYGGEEFSIILPETRGIKAFELADRIRQALAREAFDLGEGHQVRLTVSIGMASFPTDAEQVENLVKVADDALYAVKKAGRNRVCWRGHFAGPE